MLPNHSSCCLDDDGTARQDRRGEPHLSGTATFGNPKTEPTASLTNGNSREAALLERYLLVALAHVVMGLAGDAGKNVQAQALREMVARVEAIPPGQP